MIRHMFILVWRRRRANGFLAAEFLLTYLVLFGIFTVMLDALERYRQPNGFTVENVLNITAAEVGGRPTVEENASVYSRIGRELNAMDEIAHVGFAGWSLYQSAMNLGTYDIEDGRKVEMNAVFLSDSCRDILSLDLVQGRWFGPEDDGELEFRPVVVNRRLAWELFGDDDPVGKVFTKYFRVIGVISDFRLYGEFDEPRNLNIQRNVIPPIHEDLAWYAFGAILVKLNRPVTAELSARILETLQAIEPSRTYTITPAEDLHVDLLKQRATPYLLAGVASAALVGMVVLGLFGVLWQNVARRTREIGLRRAKGATARHIYTQILGEMCIVSSAGIVVGAFLVSQLLITDVLAFIPLGTHLAAMGAAALFLWGTVAVCSLYPGFMAVRINPAVALRYE